ncbi:hypothetical protein ACIA59_24005 [Micromonospora haikouensis]|uniref:hypothetical protein n=1 Tax=Micromonospora haikouensis TaxID=686309 RepID=UPI0037926EDC
MYRRTHSLIEWLMAWRASSIFVLMSVPAASERPVVPVVSFAAMDPDRGDDWSMLRSMLAYGLDLGGPGSWRLKGFKSGDELRTEWYDERNPLHDFPTAATAHFVGEVSNRHERELAEQRLPYMIEAQHLIVDLDSVASPRYVLVINDSAADLTDPEEHVPSAAVDSDWDIMLDAALAELGLQPADRPRWLRYQGGTIE